VGQVASIEPLDLVGITGMIGTALGGRQRLV
jgi:hypothetical protein